MKLALSLLLFSFGAMAARPPDPYKYFDNNGVKIAYRSFGSGAPLLVLNGGPGRSSDTFTHLAEKLSLDNHRQAIIFDQRGTGRSKLPVLNGDTVSLRLMVTDIEALRQHLHFGKISILGHSFGGMYAMAYAAQYPENIESLILSCSGGVDLSWQTYVQHNMLSRLSQVSRDKYAFWTSPEQEEKDPEKAGREANPNYSTPGLNQLVWKSMKDFDLKGAFSGFKAPTLIIDGRQDILGEAVPMTIHQEFPNSALNFLDECSHYPWLDSPEKYFTLIENFLSQLGPR